MALYHTMFNSFSQLSLSISWVPQLLISSNIYYLINGITWNMCHNSNCSQVFALSRPVLVQWGYISEICWNVCWLTHTHRHTHYIYTYSFYMANFRYARLQRSDALPGTLSNHRLHFKCARCVCVSVWCVCSVGCAWRQLNFGRLIVWSDKCFAQ